MKDAYNTSAYGSFAYVYDIFMESVVKYICHSIWKGRSMEVMGHINTGILQQTM